MKIKNKKFDMIVDIRSFFIRQKNFIFTILALFCTTWVFP